jgi:hypothetical protein
MVVIWMLLSKVAGLPGNKKSSKINKEDRISIRKKKR